MVKYDTLVWWVADFIPNGYSFYILPELRNGRRVIIFNKRGVRGKNWLLEIHPHISKSELKSAISDTLFSWDRDKYTEFRERVWIKDVKSGEVRPTLIQEYEQKKQDRREKKEISNEIRKSERRKRLSIKKF